MPSSISTTTVLKTIIPEGFTPTLPPRKRAKTKEEKEQRRIERIMRNRRAARKSRERKRLYMESMESKLKIYDEIFDLLNIRDQLKDKYPTLLDKLCSFQDGKNHSNDNGNGTENNDNDNSNTTTPNDDYTSKEDHEGEIDQFYSYLSPSSSTVSNSYSRVDQDNLDKQEIENRNIEDFFLFNNLKQSNDPVNNETMDGNNNNNNNNTILVSAPTITDSCLFNEADSSLIDPPLRMELFDPMNSFQDSITNSNSLDFLSSSIDWDLMRNPAVLFMITNNSFFLFLSFLLLYG